jgi:lipopolysaccharide export system permease protein
MAEPPVRILTRYLLRQHIAPLVFALSALTALMVLNQIAKQLGNLVGKGLPTSVIAEVFVLSIPFIVAMTLPMAVLVAVLHTMSRLAADHEITAMTASGISVGRITRPVIFGAMAVTVLAFLWNDQLLPRANHRLRTLLVDIQRKKPSLALKEQVINEVVPGQFFLRSARIDPATNRLRDVTIYDLGDADRRRIITADSGRMAYTPGQTDLYLTLVDGDIQEVRRGEAAQFNRTFFHVNHIRVRGVSNQLVRTEEDTYRGDREMTVCEMQQVVKAADADARAALREADATVRRDLQRLAGLAPGPTPTPVPPDSSPSLYCRLLGRLGAWLLPRKAAAQTPQTPIPSAAVPQVRVPAPTSAAVLPLVTPGGTSGLDDRLDGDRRRAAVYLVEIHKKYAIATACLAFALLGVPLALRFPRGGAGLVIGASVFVFAIYYIGLIGGEDLGDRLIVSPFLSMWTPNLLFGTVGLIGVWVMRRASPTARGGDWSDLKDAVFGVFRRAR